MPFLPFGTGDPIPWLAGLDMLLVLTGSDHLSAEAANWLQRLLMAAPGKRLLMAAVPREASRIRMGAFRVPAWTRNSQRTDDT
ncbi:hypothetical protein HET69_08280 [Streptomyces sp. CJ_13]|uniref:hypothetical protein n=1 Tax=Streptomyces sp. CJ_13 TaxID=2724943 RepID=UPI001BDC6604|nr:hypothetical protein [Streptomyces sp. CJ_13]MBT1184011.1 hypothetical protein [Streptomyces sp. CJ_13]